MTTRPPAEIGMSLDEVDTPALIVDLDAFERNLRRLADRVQGKGVRLRPHAKTHKCPVIALKQIALGAVGVCVPEGQRGRGDGLWRRAATCSITNEVVGRQKLRRLMALAHTARVGVCVDDPAQIADLDAAASEAGIEPAGACRDQHGRQPLRRRAGPAGARPGPPHRRQPLPALRRAAGLSRLGAASARLGRAAEGDRRRGRQGAATRDLLRQAASRATTSPAPAPARSSSRPAAASIPSCNAARTSSWTPITAAISTRTAADRAFEHRACSSGRP